MNYELKITGIKGVEEVALTIWPSSDTEIQFFKSYLHNNKLELITVPSPDTNVDKIMIREFKPEIKLTPYEEPTI